MSFKIKSFKIKTKTWLFLVILATIFFVGTASYNYLTQKAGFVKWGSPDETANYTFAKLYAQTGQLQIFDKNNLYAADLIHPRSVRSDAGELKPISFLGIILVYGEIATVLGVGVLPYLTPLLAALGLLLFYWLIKELFGKNNALISTALLAVFPVYIYYTAHSFYHNVPFIVFLLAGLDLMILALRPENLLTNKNPRTWIFWRAQFVLPAAAGLAIGLTLLMRASEILWLIPLLFIIWIFNIRKIGWTRLIVFGSFIGLTLLPMFYYNQVLYGSLFNGGYVEINRSLQNITQATSHSLSIIQALKVLKNTIFYFGFNPQQSFELFGHYFRDMFWWLFWPAAAGCLIFLAAMRKWSKGQIIYVLSWVLSSLILIIYYGSWKFFDNINQQSYTIGNSYTRYWLPIYLGALPFVALFIQKITRWPLKRWPKIMNGMRILLVLIIAGLSLNFVLFGSEEGLYYNYQTAKINQIIFTKVLADTEATAVIITRYHDKVFFPERPVIVGLLTDDQMNYYYAQLAKRLPVYYFNFSIDGATLNYLNNTKLAKNGLKIKLVELMGKDLGLYKLEKIGK